MPDILDLVSGTSLLSRRSSIKSLKSKTVPCFQFSASRTAVSREGVDEALSSIGAGGAQYFPEIEDGASLVTGISGNKITSAYSRANLAKSVPTGT